MASLVAKIERRPLAEAMRDLRACREYLLDSVRKGFAALAAQELSFTQLKREGLKLTGPKPKGVGKEDEGLGEILNQGATLSRAIDALDWVEKHAGVPESAHIWAHPSTSSGFFNVGQRRLNHDIVVAPNANPTSSDELLVFEVSDTVPEGRDGNEKLPKDLFSLGLLDRAVEDEGPRVKLPGDTYGRCRRFLVTSPGLSNVVRNGWMTVAEYVEALADATEIDPTLPAGMREERKQKLDPLVREALRRLLQADRSAIAMQLQAAAGSSRVHVTSKQSVCKQQKLVYAPWMPAMRPGDAFVVATFVHHAAANDTSLFEVSAITSESCI